MAMNNVFRSSFRYAVESSKSSFNKWSASSFGDTVSLGYNRKWTTAIINVLGNRQCRQQNRCFHYSKAVFGRTYYIDRELELKTENVLKKFAFPVRHVEIETCPTLYDGLRQPHEHRSETALKFKVAYIDTNPYADNTVPVVLMLHGAPGSHLDFDDVINSLAKQEIRVIGLNFPGYGWTPMDEEYEFLHTTKEKTAYVQDFLKSINIQKIDVIMAHSAGTYPALRLCSTTNLVKSVLLVNPGGPRHMKSLEPYWYLKLHAFFCHMSLLRPFLLSLLKLTLVLMKFRNTNAIQMSVAVETLANVKFEEQVNDALAVARKNIPTVMMYNEKDRAVEAEISEELGRLLGMTPSVTRRVDEEGNVLQNVCNIKGDRFVRLHVFEGRGHFVMQQHPTDVNLAVHELLKEIQK